MGKLDGRIAIVTGGSRNIGQEICVLLASEGATVNIFDVGSTEETLEKIKAIGGKAEAYTVNVANSSEVNAVVDEIRAKYGRIDILVNNAAVLTVHENLLTVTDEIWEREIAINLTGTFYCCRAVAAGMIEQKYGKIINISSLGGDTGRLNASAAYSSSKGAVAALSRSMAKSIAKYGINVNTVCPGLIATDIVKNYSEEQMEKLLQEVPYTRQGVPTDVANAVLFLASPDSDYVNGARLQVNGGSWMG